ncbi:nucleotidyl transferase AbiEii/AbiGii toxin family protein [bacterium]|nr:MAG: nucleotidyl transferase AbiEii/AbiGii toxin family protein [bacterium]
MSNTLKHTQPVDKDNKISQKLVEAFSKKHKVEYPTGEKVLWMSRVLHALSVSPIGPDFALMGGSAIVFLYRSMYRFSTDLDLDFIGNKDLGKKGKGEISQRQKSDMYVLLPIAEKLGCQFKRNTQKDERFVQYEMSYPSYYTRRGVVELDMSYRYCHSVLGPVNLPWPISFDGIIPNFKVQSLKQEELYASKALAMVDAKERLDFPGKIGLMFKRKIRHLFDVYFLADEVMNGDSKVDIDQLHNLVVLFGMSRMKNFQYFRGNAIGSYTEADVKNELRAVVPRGVPIPSVEEMKWQVRKFFDLHVYNWAIREHRFIEDFVAGNFRPEDLFGGGAISKSLHGMQYYKEILGKVRTIS